MWMAMVATVCRRMALPLIALLTLLPLSALRAETLDELYEKAKAEKSLVFYTGAGVAAAKATAEAFEKRFPGISVTGKGGFSNVLDSRSEGEGGKVTSVLYRRGCGRSQGHGGGLREALSWHLGHRQRRLQQRAGLRDRPAAQRQEGHHRLRAVSDHPRLSPVGQGGSADAFQT